MSIKKPFCAIGLIFFDLKFAVFSKWQAILRLRMSKRQAKNVFYWQETEIQWQELARSESGINCRMQKRQVLLTKRQVATFIVKHGCLNACPLFKELGKYTSYYDTASLNNY
jgi:hypothetical protein